MKINRKGKEFERFVARAVLADAPGFGKKDCYRTPLSGGHPFGETGDLVISPGLRKFFPFVVECKHRKDWGPGVMFQPRKEERSWILQVLRATRKNDFAPLLVMRGNATEVYAAAPLRTVEKYLPHGRTAPLLYFQVALPEREWLMMPLKRFTAELRRKIETRKGKR